MEILFIKNFSYNKGANKPWQNVYLYDDYSGGIKKWNKTGFSWLQSKKIWPIYVMVHSDHLSGAFRPGGWYIQTVVQTAPPLPPENLEKIYVTDPLNLHYQSAPL